MRTWCICAPTALIHSVAYFSASGFLPSRYSRGWAGLYHSRQPSAYHLPRNVKGQKTKQNIYIGCLCRHNGYNLNAGGPCHFLSQTVLTQHALRAIIRIDCKICNVPQSNLFRQSYNCLIWVSFSFLIKKNQLPKNLKKFSVVTFWFLSKLFQQFEWKLSKKARTEGWWGEHSVKWTVAFYYQHIKKVFFFFTTMTKDLKGANNDLLYSNRCTFTNCVP